MLNHETFCLNVWSSSSNNFRHIFMCIPTQVWHSELCAIWRKHSCLDICNSLLNLLWPSDIIRRHKFGLLLTKVMTRFLTAPSNYLNQFWSIIKCALWHSPKSNYTRHGGLLWRLRVWKIWLTPKYNFVCFNNERRGVYRTCSTINSLTVLYCWLDETVLGRMANYQ